MNAGRLILLWALLGLATAPAWAQDDPPDDGDTGSSEQVDEDEEAFRRSMELGDTEDEDMTDMTPSTSPYGGNTPTDPQEDPLPESSREHLDEQMREVIMEVGQWEPADMRQDFPYEPSPAAKSDPDLAAEEAAEWQEMIEEYHAREKAAWEAEHGQPAESAGGGAGQGDGNSGDGEGDSGGGGGGSGGGSGGGYGAGVDAGEVPPGSFESGDGEAEEAGDEGSFSAMDFIKDLGVGSDPAPGQDNAPQGAGGGQPGEPGSDAGDPAESGPGGDPGSQPGGGSDTDTGSGGGSSGDAPQDAGNTGGQPSGGGNPDADGSDDDSGTQSGQAGSPQMPMMDLGALLGQQGVQTPETQSGDAPPQETPPQDGVEAAPTDTQQAPASDAAPGDPGQTAQDPDNQDPGTQAPQAPTNSSGSPADSRGQPGADSGAPGTSGPPPGAMPRSDLSKLLGQLLGALASDEDEDEEAVQEGEEANPGGG